jgi:hypothetical protein
LNNYRPKLSSERLRDCSPMSEADMTAYDFTNGFRRISSRTTVVHAAYLTAIGGATVGWLGLLARAGAQDLLFIWHRRNSFDILKVKPPEAALQI